MVYVDLSGAVAYLGPLQSLGRLESLVQPLICVPVRCHDASHHGDRHATKCPFLDAMHPIVMALRFCEGIREERTERSLDSLDLLQCLFSRFQRRFQLIRQVPARSQPHSAHAPMEDVWRHTAGWGLRQVCRASAEVLVARCQAKRRL